MLTAVGQRELTTHRTEQTPTIIRSSGNPYSKKYDKKNLKTTYRRDVTSVRARVYVFFLFNFTKVLDIGGRDHDRGRKPDRRRQRERFTIKPRATGYDLGEVTRT